MPAIEPVYQGIPIRMVSFAMKIIHFFFVILVLLPPVNAAAEAELPSELAAAIKDADFTTDGIGLFIQGVDDDEPLVALHADQFLNPASVIKLVTTAAALDLLGQGYRWSTEVMYTGKIEGHTLNGDLYFRGNGDPYLTPERFWRLLNRIFIYGIHRITGNVLIDNSYFEPGKVDYAAFDQQPYRTYNVGPNAVLVGFQATEFHFDIDTTGTDPAVKITPFPQSPRLRIINQLKLVNGRCNAWQKRLSLETRNN
jgi:D-alanyl-D-alanine carboxypeptidase/D-alanyl-D-alanine-endopeptidase (penicillin-binding protein 4)